MAMPRCESRKCSATFITREVRYLGLAESTEEKLARFLLDLPAKSSRGTQAKVLLTLTQQSVCQMIELLGKPCPGPGGLERHLWIET
jgi:hypothetical protein